MTDLSAAFRAWRDAKDRDLMARLAPHEETPDDDPLRLAFQQWDDTKQAEHQQRITAMRQPKED